MQLGKAMNEAPGKRTGSPLLNLWRRLGPGLVTGAADDDPSGIGTHSQIGAQFGTVVFVADVPWGTALKSLFVPSIELSGAYATSRPSMAGEVSPKGQSRLGRVS